MGTKVGVVEVNWKGLYEDSKWSWMVLLGLIITVISLISYLISINYFSNKKIAESVEKIKILDKSYYFGPRVLIKGEITNNMPMEVRLPKNCEVNQKYIGQDLKVNVSTEYKEYTNTEVFQITDLNQICT